MKSVIPKRNPGAMTHLRYRFRIYPTLPQRVMLAKTFGCVRTVFDDAVAARRAARAEGRRFPSTAELDKTLITAAKHTAERAWLAEASFVPLQQTLRDCDAAYRSFFDSLKGSWNRSRTRTPKPASTSD